MLHGICYQSNDVESIRYLDCIGESHFAGFSHAGSHIHRDFHDFLAILLWDRKQHLGNLFRSCTIDHRHKFAFATFGVSGADKRMQLALRETGFVNSKACSDVSRVNHKLLSMSRLIPAHKTILLAQIAFAGFLGFYLVVVGHCGDWI